MTLSVKIFTRTKRILSKGADCPPDYLRLREGLRHLYEPDMERGRIGECRKPGLSLHAVVITKACE